MIAAQFASKKFWLTVIEMGALLGLFFVAFDVRTARMFPVNEALLYPADYDEGVHVAAGQLLAQGFAPYRDFLFLQPPFAAMLFASIARVNFTDWGSETTFAFARYAAIAAGLISLVFVFLIARKLGGALAGLIAVGVLAVDALVVATDRRVMLEPYVNLFSVLAIWLFLVAQERHEAHWMVGVGIIGVLVFFTKTTGVVVALAIGVYLAAQWMFLVIPTKQSHLRELAFALQMTPVMTVRALVFFVIGGVIAVALIAGFFLVTCPEQFFKQVYLIHFARVPDGTLTLADRFTEIVGNPGSRLTLVLAFAGCVVLVVRGALRQSVGRWGVIGLWFLGIVALFATSRTYFPHYYAQLAAPLAILASGVASHARTDHRALIGVQIAVALIVVTTNWQAGITQFELARAVADQRSASARDIGRFLATQTPSHARVLALSPLYAVLGSRPLAGTGARNFLIDSYGAILYVNIGMEDAWLPEPFFQDIWSAIHFVDGQNEIVKAASAADYVIIDRQARWELTPETISAITTNYKQIFETAKIAVFVR